MFFRNLAKGPTPFSGQKDTALSHKSRLLGALREPATLGVLVDLG